MVLLLNKIGGTNLEDRGDKTALSEEHTLTWEALLNSYINNAELSFRVLQSNNVFTNAPNIVVDEFTDANGTKNTVNTGSSLTYDITNDRYTLSTSNDVSGDTTNSSHTITNEANAFDNDYDTYAEISTNTSGNQTLYLGKTFSSTNIINISYKFEIYNEDSNGAVPTAYLQTYNGTSWTNLSTLITGVASGSPVTYSITGTNYLNASIQGVRILFSGGADDAGDIVRLRVYKLSYGDFDTSSILVADTNTASLDGNELGFAISVPDADIPTNTSITATISDGTNSLSAVTIDSVSKGAIVGNPGTLSSGTLKCTFTLNTTDTSVTPTINGYCISIIRE